MQALYSLALALACVTTALGQTRVYVTPTGTGGGTSWADARGDLATAMAQAMPNTEIWVAQGSYEPLVCGGACSDNQRSTSFELRSGVTVIGGFTGVETSAAQASPANVTTLSGDIGVDGDPTDNTYNVVVCARCGDGAALANLTISGGYADRPGVSPTSIGAAGAGLYLDGDNYGGTTGEASPTLTDCTIADNFARGQGGGVYVEGAGGGEASPSFVSCVLEDNIAAGAGGAVVIDVSVGGNADIAFAGSQFVDNGTTAFMSTTAGPGGALFVNGGNGVVAVTMDRCLGTGNTTDLTTAGTVSGNSNANGGFVYVTGATRTTASLTLRNSVLTANSAFSGGAVYLLRGTGTFTNVTIANNVARGSGGSAPALYFTESDGVVANSVIFGNTIPSNSGSRTKDVRWERDANLTARYTLFSSADRAELTADASPQSTYTEGPGILYGLNPDFVDPNARVPVLSDSSPAVNAGGNASAFAAGGDYFGQTRIDDGTVDLGAVEFQGATVPVELVYFRGEPTAEGVSLTWATGAEVGAEGFRVRRSTDAEPDSVIGFVHAAGPRAYRFVDPSARSGVRYYYQLESVDLDGTTERSEVITVLKTSDAPASRVHVFPNPASDQFFLEASPGPSPSAGLRVTLSDVTGRTVREWRTSSDGRQALSLRDVPAGLYVLRTEGPTDAVTLLTVQP